MRTVTSVLTTIGDRDPGARRIGVTAGARGNALAPVERDPVTFRASSFSAVLTPGSRSAENVRTLDWGLRSSVTNKSRKSLILGPRELKRSKSVVNGEPLFF